MGWMSKTLEKIGVLVEEEAPSLITEEIHAYELQEWLDKRAQERVQQHALDEEVPGYLNRIKDQLWFLDGKLEQWKEKNVRESKVNYVLLETKRFLETVSKLSPPTVLKLIEQHQQLDSSWEKICLVADELKELPMKEPAGQVLPLTSFLDDLRSLKETIDKKITQSGMRNLHSLSQKAQVIEQQTEAITKVQELLRQRQEKLQEVQLKKQEKEKTMQQLQEEFKFTNVGKLREQREKLVKDLQSAENPQWRTELRQQLDSLERSTGNREYLYRLDDLQFRLDHFQQQEQRYREDVSILQENLQETSTVRDRQIDLFMNMTKISLGKEVKVKV